MKLIFASDSFKGTLSSAQIGQLLVQAAGEILPDAECIVCPIADGGEGTLDAIHEARSGDRITFPAHDGLMRPVQGEILVLGDTTFVEAASTCGLAMLKDDERNPLSATSYGVGECIRFALDQGCSKIVVGLGGSCTNDGGMGCLHALGIRFLDAAGHELLGRGGELGKVVRIDESGLHPGVRGAAIAIMSDVDNPLLGPNGATWIFGPQKGADKESLEELESGMSRFASAVAAVHPETNFDTPGFGAAGGLGMALAVFLNAKIRSGVEELLNLIDFDSIIDGANLVVTGEGKLDGQSLQGKAIGGVVVHAQRKGTPVVAICGKVALGESDLHELGLSQAIDTSKGQELNYALAHAEQNYLKAARDLFASLQTEPMTIRKSTERDFNRIMEVYAMAREFMAQHGNPNQWGPTGWPPETLVRRDIGHGKSYVCEYGGRIIGVFFYDFGKDIEPTYAHIEDGLWLDDSPYGVVHRIASDGSVKGVGSACINWAFSQCGHLRIDTHGDNVVMQHLLTKLGFTHCGTIFVEEDDYPRLAFERSGRGAISG